jgi:hypothetical protein
LSFWRSRLLAPSAQPSGAICASTAARGSLRAVNDRVQRRAAAGTRVLFGEALKDIWNEGRESRGSRAARIHRRRVLPAVRWAAVRRDRQLHGSDRPHREGSLRDGHPPERARVPRDESRHPCGPTEHHRAVPAPRRSGAPRLDVPANRCGPRSCAFYGATRLKRMSPVYTGHTREDKVAGGEGGPRKCTPTTRRCRAGSRPKHDQTRPAVGVCARRPAGRE